MQIFISYSSKDRAFVNLLARQLAARLPHADVVYDMLIEPGVSWAEALAAKVAQADVVLAVLSPDFLESRWTQNEVQIAVERQLEGRTRLIPLLQRPCTPTGYLAALTWVDFTADFESALTRLIWGITATRPQAAKGEQPGTPAREISPVQLQEVQRDAHEAVELFKSRPADTADAAMPPVRRRSRATGRKPSASPRKTAPAKRTCFVVMPFGNEDLQVVYEDFVRPTLIDGCRLHCERGDDARGSRAIIEDILTSIRKADIVLADLTTQNANVFYEVGICHALDKSVLLLAQSMDDVPFDLRHRRVLLYDYTPRGCKKLEKALKEHMLALLQAP